MGASANAVESLGDYGTWALNQFIKKLVVESVASTTASDGTILSTIPKLIPSDRRLGTEIFDEYRVRAR